MVDDLGGPHFNLVGDAPKLDIAEDAFGLAEIARAIALVVRDRVAADGYAIGIEGKWGSGKTTLLNFVEQLLKQDEIKNQIVLRFDPWLVGNKQALLATFFEDLNEVLSPLKNDARLRGKVGEEAKSALDRLSGNIAKYGKYLTLTASTVSSATTLIPSVSAKIAAFGLSTLAKIASLFQRPPPSLEALKERIVGDLRVVSGVLPHVRVAVLIDDTDRLEPDESVEILRLIKAVANFPVVTYLVCFDMGILSKQVEEIVRVGAGADYLEKVFQQIVPLPPQEPFALRRFVRSQLTEQFPAEMTDKNVQDMDVTERLDAVFDRWLGKLIETPRDAVRLCDNVRFGWPYLREQGDFLDHVWLQLVKLKCRPLYDWARDYVTSLGAYRDGGRPSDGESEREAARLRSILEKLDWGRAPDHSGITSILPGLKSVLLEGTKSRVFEFTPDRELAQFEENRRLGSPSHWRAYFAYQMPSYALDDADIERFRKLATADRSAAAAFLRELAQRPHRSPGFFLDVLLDRMRDRAGSLGSAEQVGMAWAFADMMDELPRDARVQFSDNDPWRKSLRLLGPAVGSQFVQIVAEGRSINWLAIAMRDQGFALGLANPDRNSPDRQWLTREQFEQAFAEILKRFRHMGLDAIFALPEPAQVLFCWDQLGGSSNELRKLLAEETRHDDGKFIRALGAMRSWVSSSDKGVYHALQPEILVHFFDLDEVLRRLTKISQSADPDLKTRASELLGVIDEERFQSAARGQKIPR
jgi:hypothetical protein